MFLDKKKTWNDCWCKQKKFYSKFICWSSVTVIILWMSNYLALQRRNMHTKVGFWITFPEKNTNFDTKYYFVVCNLSSESKKQLLQWTKTFICIAWGWYKDLLTLKTSYFLRAFPPGKYQLYQVNKSTYISLGQGKEMYNIQFWFWLVDIWYSGHLIALKNAPKYHNIAKSCINPQPSINVNDQ